MFQDPASLQEALGGQPGLGQVTEDEVTVAERNLEAYYRQMVERAETPYPEAMAVGEPRPPRDPLSALLAPALTTAYQRAVRGEVEYEGTLAVVALERYCLERGGYPDTLEQLVPDFLPAVPLDVFVQQPLAYARLGTSYLLYSVGPNMVDDGFVAVPGQDLGDAGDIVFHTPE
jgi:hypothetical protein